MPGPCATKTMGACAERWQAPRRGRGVGTREHRNRDREAAVPIWPLRVFARCQNRLRSELGPRRRQRRKASGALDRRDD